MVLAYDISLLLYNVTLIPMIFFSVLFITLAIVNLLATGNQRPTLQKLKKLPFVSVQIPTFNDPIAARCIEKCLQFNYPKDRFEIIIADDSTNIQTQQLLASFAKKNPDNVKYIHRTNRVGFKPGALKNAMKDTKGEILVLFDADWIPKQDFLLDITKPFADPQVAIVQARQGFYNHEKNMITRFASYLLMIHHAILLPIANKLNCVFLCGTAGALRRSAFEKVGGWNLGSITEDADLSVKLLLEGYKTVYIEHETPSEVPDTLEGFIKQQMRWCYGNVRVFFDHASDILFNPKLTIGQRFVMMYLTCGNIIAPVVVGMTIFGFAGWFLGEPTLFNFQDLITMVTRVILTAGFFFLGYVALRRLGRQNEIRQLVISGFTLGLVLAVANTVACFRAISNKKLGWYCTPKTDNSKAL